MSVDMIVQGKIRDLGGFSVHRSLPTMKKRSVGPFVFLDHMGPMKLTDEAYLSVRPHPHIGLMTVTYLYEGRVLHKDSLGSKQLIHPGEINLMIAGRGIVHSERTPEDDRKNPDNKKVNGIQIWVALPVEHEQCEPEFLHYGSEHLPTFELSSSASLRLLMGEWQNKKSNVKTFTKTFFAALTLKKEAKASLTLNYKELGFLVVKGRVSIDGQELSENELFIKESLSQQPHQFELSSQEETEIAIIGGEPLPEPRFIWWNLVSSKKELIHKAAEKWKNQSMGKVEGEVDFIPLPETPSLP